MPENFRLGCRRRSPGPAEPRRAPPSVRATTQKRRIIFQRPVHVGVDLIRCSSFGTRYYTTRWLEKSARGEGKMGEFATFAQCDSDKTIDTAPFIVHFARSSDETFKFASILQAKWITDKSRFRLRHPSADPFASDRRCHRLRGSVCVHGAWFSARSESASNDSIGFTAFNSHSLVVLSRYSRVSLRAVFW